ncbi:RNA polymerase sigma factor [Sutcliffiella rhizosphaerae]|uniref:RNA polymerase sigma factor n=1 Tax=Sutcliffiella rhizosphaerae TaxID=2880967 RepID=UPI001E40A2B4|nr:RNA polymerase sigma factor [Sutcliffiella rhizosphaerae]
MDEENAKQKVREWYMLYSDEIYRFIYLLIRDHEQAKDLMHDTFLKSYFSLEQYQGRASVKNWLYRIARNLTIDYKRKSNPISYYLTEWNLISVNREGCPQRILDLGESERHFYMALSKLKHSYQEVILLRKVKELSTRETAEVLNWSEAKVKTTLSRAQDALKRTLEEEGYIHGEV